MQFPFAFNTIRIIINRLLMMKKIFFLLLLSLNVIAQKKNFTMKDAVLGMNTSFAVQNLKQLKWMGTSDYYAQIIANNDVNAIVRTNANNTFTDTFITLNQLNEIIKTKFTVLPNVEWVNESSFLLKDGELNYLVSKANDSFKTEVIATLPEVVQTYEISPSKKIFAFLSKNNLFVANATNQQQITFDGTENLVYGKAVHRDEFGITGGLFWSPKSNAIAFYRMDQTMVEDYPIINWSETPAIVKTIKYPFAGRKSHHVKIGIYNLKSMNTIYLETGEPKEQYLTTVTWSPDEKVVYVSLLNRDQNHLQLNKYDATSGAFLQTLFEEKNEKYVEPQHPLWFFNHDAKRFIWRSQRDGFSHLYLYESNGKLVKQLTKGKWVVNETAAYSASSNEIIFTSSKDGVMQKNVYAVNLKTTKQRLLNKQLATHTISANSNVTYLLDQFVGKNIPRQIDLIQIKSAEIRTILAAKSTLNDYAMANVEDVVLDKNALPLYGKLMKPADFDSSKKYPVIVYLYNGPHVQLNKDTYPYSGNLWYDYLTQRGFLVFVMDGRGSANRGFEFESSVFKKLGTLEMEDQIKGVNYLKSLSYVDTNRMGIHGWSFGGFMTTSFMLRKPDVFKCGIAGGPVLDWSMYEIMYTERYMDTPTQNPTGYADNLLLDKVKNLKGKLLMIHGADDDVVVWQHSMKFVKRCVEEGVQLDYFIYPGHPHNVRGKDRIHLMQKITDYFEANLK
jgi:dipeptidyl-peptidase 4